RFTLKCSPSGQHFVQYTAERKDVTTLVRCMTSRLFRRHVAGSPEDHSTIGCGRAQDGWRVGCHLLSCAFKRFRQSKVEDLHFTVRRDFHIRRLQITMNDTFLVRGLHCLGDLASNLQRLLYRNPATANTIGQRLAFDEFEYEEACVVRLL